MQERFHIAPELIGKSFPFLHGRFHGLHQLPVFGFHQGIKEVFFVFVVFVYGPLPGIRNFDDFVQGSLTVSFVGKDFFSGFQDPFFFGKGRIDFHHSCWVPP